MKSYLLLSAFSLLIYSCIEPDVSIPQEPEFFVGTASVEMNGEPILGKTSLLVAPSPGGTIYNLRIEIEYPAAEVSPNFNFTELPLKTDTLFLQDGSSVFTIPAVNMYLARGDIFGGFYDLISTDTVIDFIQFTKIDKQGNHVEGKFQASFLIVTNWITPPSESFADTLIFRNGTFKTKLQ